MSNISHQRNTTTNVVSMPMITLHGEKRFGEQEEVEDKVASLLGLKWKADKINRTRATGALAGVLIRTYAWPLAKVKQLVQLICEEAKDTGLQERLKTVEEVNRKIKIDEKSAPGIPSFKRIFGAESYNEFVRIITSSTSDEGMRPEIDAGIQNLEIISGLAWDALVKSNDPPLLFRQGNNPRRLEEGDDGTRTLRDLNSAALRYELARAADWVSWKKNEKGERERIDAKPPMDVVSDMLAAPDIPLPPLNRITEIPVFAPDGSLQTTPGYHEAARTYFEPTGAYVVPTVPQSPTNEDIEKAKKLLVDGLLGDFPFTCNSDRAHAVALVLLPAARDLIAGPTPLHFIAAPTPGSGKSLLVDAALRISCGSNVTTMVQTSQEDEWRKRLTANFLAAKPIIYIDNIRDSLDSGVLAAALTDTRWGDRLLSLNKIIEVPVRCVWVATANNPKMSMEIARRSVSIRLDSNTERPWMREGFRHPDLRAWVDENRSELVWAVLTLIQSWIAVSRPRPKVKPLGSYEGWTHVIGGILETAGIPGFLSNLSEFYEAADLESDAWQSLVEAWNEKFGQTVVTAADLFPPAVENEEFDFNDVNSVPDKIRFGKMLGQQRDRIINGHRITQAGEKQRAKCWKLTPLLREKDE